MLQIFLIGSISGISYFLIGCSKKGKNVVQSEKKEKSKKEMEKPIRIYRNEKTQPIPPRTYEEFVERLEGQLWTCMYYAKGKHHTTFKQNDRLSYDASYVRFDANPTLNRFKELKCADSSRVILENRKNDYINASWVVCDEDEYRGKNILTQGPLKHTIPDFWAMIYQEKVEYIVMFCSFIEKGVEQCAQYYPTKEGVEKYDNFEVKYVKKEEDPVEGVTWTVLHLFDKNGNDTRPRRVNHIYVSWWPEKTAPDDPKLTIELYKWLMKNNESHIPMVFHCNNGIGRSATFAAIYFFIRLDFDEYDMFDGTRDTFLRFLHNFRNGAIETPLQYCFFVCCSFELCIQEGRIKRTKEIDDMMSDYKKYAQKVRDCVKAGKEVKIDEIFPPSPEKKMTSKERCLSYMGSSMGLD